MLPGLVNKIRDYFIHDASDLELKVLYKKRTLVSIALFAFIHSLITSVLHLLGYFSEEASLILFALFSTTLILMKFTRNIYWVMWCIIGGGTIAVIYNIGITGDIYSYNHKWFILIMLLVNFYMPRATAFFLVFVLGFEFYSYQVTVENIQMLGLKEDYLLDNILCFIFCFVILRFFIQLHEIQKSTIDKQNALLKTQKGELVESNYLLQRRSEELVNTNQELERFAHVASHDLKTPLNNIISFSLLLEEELKDIENESVHQYFSFIKKGSQKMLDLIKNVLEFSVNSSKDDNLEWIDLNELIESITDSISEYIKSRNGEVIIGGTLPTLKGNRTKMFLLFKNLIENGLKYNKAANPKVELSVIKENGTVQFKIEDNGIGIKTKYHNEIFQMFTRLHRDIEYEGTGLGLAFCKKVVDEFDGEISLRSAPGYGSQFYIELDESHFLELKVEDLV